MSDAFFPAAFDATGDGLPFRKRELWAELSDAARARVCARYLWETTGTVTPAQVRDLLRRIDPEQDPEIGRNRCQEAIRALPRRRKRPANVPLDRE